MPHDDKPCAETSIKAGLTGAAPSGMPVAVVYTTLPSMEAAGSVGRALVEAQLAGCVNIIPGMTSIYIWQGRLEEAGEVVLLAKTAPERTEACMQAIAAAHPYENPAILVLQAPLAAKPYAAWLRSGCGLGAGA